MPGCYAVFHKQLGDLLLLEPALARLRGHHGPPVRVLTRTGHAPLLQLMEGVVYQPGLPLAWQSHLVCYDPLNKSALRSLLAPAGKKQCVLPEKREMQWFHRPLFGDVIVPELGDQYVAEYFWQHTPVPATGSFRMPRLNPPPGHWRPDGLDGAPFVLLNPTSGWRQKCWQAESWAGALRHWHETKGWRFLMTSASTDWQTAHCREIAERAGPCVRSLASRTTLENFLWLSARAQAVVTVDGAASHLAQAFGVPSLTLFGPTNMANWHRGTPRNLAVQAPPSKDGKRRLKNLSVSAVLETADLLA
jgi:ADP-heptose:LPS heptosyltransferase